MIENYVQSFLQQEGGSDIHFSPGNYPSFRIKGSIVQIKDSPKFTEHDALQIGEDLFSLLTPEEAEVYQEKLKTYGHTGFSVTIEDVRFRVNISRLGRGLHIVLRVLPSEPPLIENLGLNQRTMEGLKYATTRREGFFLVVGPTGSGKSTTLAALIRYINERHAKHIITLEDPIEYLHPSKTALVVQKELGRDFPSFQEGLHSALREDPDVILVGEIRDPKSFELALKASETGHLVFATLHTQDVVGTVNRLVALGSDNPSLTRDRLSQVLIGVIAQRLFLGRDNRRHVCWEILISNAGIRGLIREGSLDQIRSLIDNTDYSQSFNRTISELYSMGLLDRETAIALSPNPNYLNLNGKGEASGSFVASASQGEEVI